MVHCKISTSLLNLNIILVLCVILKLGVEVMGNPIPMYLSEAGSYTQKAIDPDEVDYWTMKGQHQDAFEYVKRTLEDVKQFIASDSPSNLERRNYWQKNTNCFAQVGFIQGELEPQRKKLDTGKVQLTHEQKTNELNSLDVLEKELKGLIPKLEEASSELQAKRTPVQKQAE